MRSTCRRTGRTNSSISTTMALASLASLMMSASIDCASAESGTWRRRSPAMTSMPASGFFNSCAMPRRHLSERGEAIAQALALFELFDLRQVLEEQDGANRVPVVVLDLRQGVADHAFRVPQTQLGAVGQRRHLEGCREDANDLGPLAQHVAEGPSHILRLSRQRKNPVRLVVHQCQRAVAADGDHAVSHARDDVTEEAIVGQRTASCPRARGRRARRRATAGAHTWASGHGRDGSQRRQNGQTMCLLEPGCRRTKVTQNQSVNSAATRPGL